ncbi:MAG TPA: trehalase family glycosidase [Verrucomicrobiae bacterium]|nr:trehalase family glycosidase [Verrucomicrobiae bacterium]
MKSACVILNGTVSLWLLATSAAFSQTVPVAENLQRLIAQEDTDDDQKITIHDRVTPFVIHDENGAAARTLTNFYQMSVLLQELKSADDQHTKEIAMDNLQLDESIVERTHRFIREHFWTALTRRIDANNLDHVVRDSKTAAKYDYIYVPAADAAAVKYFQSVEKSEVGQNRAPAIKVVPLPVPDKITGAFVRNLDGAHGILSLKLELDAHGHPVSGVPYVVPGGRFNELYCWDSYFIVLGLLQDDRADLARGMADNLLYEVQYYGKIPNANRTYYLTRSQPPFLTSIIRAVYDSGVVDKKWLESALKMALTEYTNVWLGSDRLVKIGDYELSRYYDSGDGPCPETEPGHYDEKIQPWLAQVKPENPDLPLTPYRFLNEYLYCGKYGDLTADGLTLAAFFKHDRAVRESGHDTTHRFDNRTTDFVSVDLNSLLYKYETDFADLLEKEFAGKLPSLGKDFGDATFWRQRVSIRKQAMLALMWDDERGYFFDYDFANQKRSAYISATGLWPLWAKMFDAQNPEDMERVKRIAAYVHAKLEEPAGLAATAKESVESARRRDARQWDYPYGWAPHQMLAWQGFKNYGFDADAQRLAYRWLYTIAKNAHDYNGMIPEKYNVVTGSHDVFAEYGNVGTKFVYIATEGFGWVNASFEIGVTFLTPEQLADLRRLQPPPPLTQ